MFTKSRWLIVLLAVVLLLGLGLIGAGAAPDLITPPPPHIGPEITISDFDNWESRPDIVYNRRRNEYFVVWQTESDSTPGTIRGARISSNGRILANFQINGHPSKDSNNPTVAYDPLHDRYLVVFVLDSAGAGTYSDIIGRFIPWEGPDPADKSFPISTWKMYQLEPDVAFGRAANEFLVVWTNRYPPPSSIHPYISGRRINAVDGSFPSKDKDLTISHLYQNRIRPSIAYNLARNEYLVVYDNEDDILGTRYTGRIDHDFGGEFSIAGWPAYETYADVAACDKVDQYFVVWESFQSATKLAVFGRYIGGDGFLGSVHKIDDTTGNEREAAVGCSDAGTEYLVAWQTEYTNLKYGLLARTVWPSGAMGQAFVVQDPSNQSHRLNAAVGGGESSAMVVWENERGNTGYWDLHGRMFTPNAVFVPVARGR